MSSLRGLIGECWEELTNGVAWVALYKDGRSWQAEAFYPKDGCYEDGYVFDAEDYGRMKEILEIDRKALALNGDNGWELEGWTPKDLSLKELEDKVYGLYVTRYHQLWSFVEDFVIPPNFENERTGLVDEILAEAKWSCDASLCDAGVRGLGPGARECMSK